MGEVNKEKIIKFTPEQFSSWQEYRQALYIQKAKSDDLFEKAITFISSGALGLTLTFHDNFKFELLEPLKKRNCLAYPDKGEFESWSKKASELNGQGFKIAVSSLLEQINSCTGIDLVDYYFSDTEYRSCI